MQYLLTNKSIKNSLDAIAARDRNVGRVLNVVGYPEARRRPEGFETLLRIIVGQQVSVAAANAIYGRVIGALGPKFPYPGYYVYAIRLCEKLGFPRRNVSTRGPLHERFVRVSSTQPAFVN